VHDGLITIKKIVSAPGERAKVAVESYDDRIDPVGACVGMKGSRIHGIVRELRNENIDVINYTTNANLYITRALVLPRSHPSILMRIPKGQRFSLSPIRFLWPSEKVGSILNLPVQSYRIRN
jgi:transcription antitermination factor NusA-like protein